MRYTAEATSDTDDGGAPSFFGYVKPARGQSTGLGGVLSGTSCAGTGVFNPTSGAKDVRMVAGACDGSSGKSEF